MGGYWEVIKQDIPKLTLMHNRQILQRIFLNNIKGID
jgi:hypothetical protein